MILISKTELYVTRDGAVAGLSDGQVIGREKARA